MEIEEARKSIDLYDKRIATNPSKELLHSWVETVIKNSNYGKQI